MTTQNTAPNTKDPKDAKDAKDAKDKPKTDATPAAAAAVAAAPEGEEEKVRASRKIYIVVGTIYEFANAKEAEKYLNAAPDAPAEFKVIKGNLVEKKQRVSLR